MDHFSFALLMLMLIIHSEIVRRARYDLDQKIRETSLRHYYVWNCNTTITSQVLRHTIWSCRGDIITNEEIGRAAIQ